MILRHDDPLRDAAAGLGEPIYLLVSNPTVERIAKLIFDTGPATWLRWWCRARVETPTSFASHTGERAGSGTAMSRPRSSSSTRRHLNRLARDHRRVGQRMLAAYGARRCPSPRSPRWWRGRPPARGARLRASGLRPLPADALARFPGRVRPPVSSTTTRPYDGVPETLAAAVPHVPLAILTNKPSPPRGA